MIARQRRIAVLGAGIMGCSAALYLARRGAAVTLFDAASEPFAAASRWNEGKIHLGYIYSADRSLRTVDHVLPGGLLFRPLLEDLIAGTIEPAVTAADDVYLCHRDSVVAPDAMWHHFRQVTQRVRQHPDAKHYLVDVSACRTERLPPSELAAITDSPDILAGFRVPERSVSTTWVADRLVAAVVAEQRIERCMATRVNAVRPQRAGDTDGAWQVETSPGLHGCYDFVINALWQGRMAIDASAGLVPAGIWSNRYRLSLFLRTAAPVDAPCVVIATGPFGDIKNYNNRDFYLSWYPDGLRVDSSELLPPAPAALDAQAEQALCASILDNLEKFLPAVARIRERAEQIALRGGWVFAAGQGLLSDPRASLHRRSDFGISRLGSYFSVDTGKYATAPWLARQLADSIV